MTLSKKAEATRQHILDTGYQLVLHKGFAALGLQEILKSCNVPKGSFYHYFPSKEAFGCELLQQYVDGYGRKLEGLLAAEGNGCERLMRYWDAWIAAPTMPHAAGPRNAWWSSLPPKWPTCRKTCAACWTPGSSACWHGLRH